MTYCVSDIWRDMWKNCSQKCQIVQSPTAIVRQVIIERNALHLLGSKTMINLTIRDQLMKFVSIENFHYKIFSRRHYCLVHIVILLRLVS
jgi:hypothetical protein